MHITTKISLAVLLSSLLSLQAQDTSNLPLKMSGTWQVFLGVETPASFDKVPSELKTFDGKIVKVKTVKTESNLANLDLGALNGSFEAGVNALVFTEIIAEKDGNVKAGAAADWQMEIYVNGKSVYSTMGKGNGSNSYKPEDHIFTFPVKAGKNLLAAKVKSGTAGWRFVLGNPSAPKPNVKFEANDEWKIVKMDDIFVKEGTALDQSAITELPYESNLMGLLGSKALPRLTIGTNGKLAAESRPDVPIRLRGTGINFPWVIGKASKQENWKAYFDQETIASKRQGYNLIRMAPAIQRKFSPEALEKTDYFLATLGKNRIYCMVDCFLDTDIRASWETGASRMDSTLRMYMGDEIVRSSWKRATSFMMNHVNPYTGLAWKDDTTIACMVLYNEQEWGFFHAKSSIAKETQMEFDVKFRQWLERKYNDYKTLAKAWGEASIKSFAEIETPASFPSGSKKVRDNDFVLFCGDLSRENIQWMTKTLRETGYKGLIAQYNISHWLEGQEVRWEESQVTIANTYHNHPTGFDKAGSKCGQDSSIGSGAWYWRGVASMRFADRPFIETEFNHSFWNPYQYECGAVFGAYSALQGLDALSIHGNGTFSTSKASGLSTFEVAKSPIARAGEFLAGYLYLRKDVKTSPHRIELQIPSDYVNKDGNGSKSVSSEQGKLAFITGFSLAFPQAKRAEGVANIPTPDLVLGPDGGSEFQSAGGGWAINSQDDKSAKFSLASAVKGLKEKGIIKEDNLSDPEKGIFQSDSGEITMRTKENLLKIVTARSEAIALEGGKSEKADALNVLKTSVPALVAASAVDTEKLTVSKRIVLVYSTYAVNSGMELSNDRTTLVNLGGAPVLMRVGKLELTLKNSNASKMSLYALGFDGTHHEKLPLKYADGILNVSIDTATLKDGPTPFFELVAE